MVVIDRFHCTSAMATYIKIQCNVIRVKQLQHKEKLLRVQELWLFYQHNLSGTDNILYFKSSIN